MNPRRQNLKEQPKDSSRAMKTQRNISMKLRRINLRDTKESTNISLIEMMKTIEDLRTEFSNETGTLKMSQAERKLELKHSEAQQENPKEQKEEKEEVRGRMRGREKEIERDKEEEKRLILFSF